MRRIAVPLLVLLASPALAEDELPLRVDLDASVRYGAVSGFAQVPRGGAVQSTTQRKPTLSQMGIDRVTSENVQLEAGWGGPGAYGGAQWIHLTGSSVLGVPLASQGTSFPEGSKVRGYLKLDWYRAGAQWAFPGPGAELPFTVRPGLGFLVLFESYRLSASSGVASRAFSSGAPEVLLDGEWMAIGPLSLLGRFSSTLPFPRIPWVLSVEARVRLRVFGDDPNGGLELLGGGARGGFVFVGLAFDRLESDDEQNPVANHIRASMGPLLTAGIEVRY